MADSIDVISQVSSVTSAVISTATQVLSSATEAVASSSSSASDVVASLAPAKLIEVLDYQIPSVDRPFGVSLWDLFAYLTPIITNGKFDPNTFEFVKGETLLSTTGPVLFICVLYYVVIFGGREVLRATGKGPYKLAFLFKAHNLMLTIISLSLLLLFIEELVPILVHNGLFYAICSSEAWTKRLVVLYFLNYLTKYVEFIDTIFLMLRKKPLTFLHTYHHGATALLCYTQLLGRTSISWVVISLNLTVHVIMYWYYFQSARGIRVWWKQWVTRGQIIQFIIDIGFVYFGTYTYYIHKYLPKLPHYGVCSGEEFAAASGCAIITSYLFLFIAFYIRIYSKSSKGKKTATKKSAVAAPVSASTTSASSSSTVPKSRKA